MKFPIQIEKVYEPQRFEPHWAQWWIDAGIFAANVEAPGRVFSLVIPPPNVTGVLHIGHMLEHTEIDVTVRWRRMLGDNTLWPPGTDHAGIATQMVVQRQLAEEGISRQSLGREAFEARVWQALLGEPLTYVAQPSGHDTDQGELPILQPELVAGGGVVAIQRAPNLAAYVSGDSAGPAPD